MIAGIVLAAGRSQRMGQNKLFLPYGETTIIERVVGELTRSALDAVYVVVGHDASRVVETFCGSSARLVSNPDYDQDMLTSLRCGLAALPPDAEAFLLALGDNPAVTADLVDRLVARFRHSEKGIVVPEYQGRRGHPILVSMAFAHEIMTGYEGVGLRGLLHAHAHDVDVLAVDTPAITEDIDTPEDYQRAVKHPRQD